jgi:thiamine kinase-like enzyme
MAFFASHGRGLGNGGTLETKQNHFFYKQGWKKYQSWMQDSGVDIPDTLRSLGDSLLKDFPLLYQINFGEGPSTFIHGDAAQYNLMFYGEGEMVMFDWQTCQMGRGIYDVAFYLVLSSSTDFLNTNEESLLALYQEKLKEAGVQYSMETLMEHYKMALVTSWAVIVYVTGLLDPSWMEKIKIAAKRTIAAVERLDAAQLAIEQIRAKVRCFGGLLILMREPVVKFR